MLPCTSFTCRFITLSRLRWGHIAHPYVDVPMYTALQSSLTLRCGDMFLAQTETR